MTKVNAWVWVADDDAYSLLDNGPELVDCEVNPAGYAIMRRRMLKIGEECFLTKREAIAYAKKVLARDRARVWAEDERYQTIQEVLLMLGEMEDDAETSSVG
jgi:hypothetical protein